MAILHLGANRILGSSTASSSGKIAGTSGTGSVFAKWTRTAGSVNDGRDNLSYDLGSTLSDTLWIMRFKLYIDTISLGSTSGCQIGIGMSDADADTAYETNQDSISFRIQFASGGSQQKFVSNNSNGGEMGGNDSVILDWESDSPVGKTFYVQIKRTSATAGTVSITENSDYTTSATTVNMTSLSASTTGLRYFVAKEYDGQTGAAANFIYGSVTDVKIYDNQSSPTTVTYDVNYFMRSTSGWNINSGIQNIVPIEVDEKATLITAEVPVSGWTVPSGNSISGGYLTTTTSSNSKAFTFGTPSSWVMDFDWSVTQYDSPVLTIGSDTTLYGDPSGNNKRMQFYFANTDYMAVSSRNGISGQNYQAGATVQSLPTSGAIKYYRFSLNVSTTTGIFTRYPTDADRTAGTNAEATCTFTDLPSQYSSGTDDYTHLIVGETGSGNNILYDWKFWTGMTTPSGDPTFSETFASIPVSSDLPANTLFEETDTRNMYFLQSNVWKRTPTTPTNISDLYAWYDATDVTTITKDGSDRVSKWENKEGTTARDLVQTTSGNQPLWLSANRNGKDVIDFATSSTGRWMKTSSMQSTVAQPISIVVVVEMPSNDSTSRDLLQGHSSSKPFPVFNKNSANDSFHISMGTNLGWTETGVADTWQYMTLIFNTTASEIRRGGVQKASGNAGTGVASPLRVGVSWNNDAFWNAKIMHVIFYSKLLSASEIEGLESWASLQGGL